MRIVSDRVVSVGGSDRADSVVGASVDEDIIGSSVDCVACDSLRVKGQRQSW